MCENGCDSTLPGSTRFSLILQIKTHATTTKIMRNVEYITNGFGGFNEDLARLMQSPEFQAAARQSALRTFDPGYFSSPSGPQGASVRPTGPTPRNPAEAAEFAIRQNLQGLPSAVVDAAIATYRQFGPSGLKRSADFEVAINRAEGSFIRMFPNAVDRLSKPNAGAFYKSALNSLINTAASRVGLTPLSSLMLRTYRNLLSKVPDSSMNPKNQFQDSIPEWLVTTNQWLPRLANTF